MIPPRLTVVAFAAALALPAALTGCDSGAPCTAVVAAADVPAAVTAALRAEFSSTGTVDWSREGTDYEATFTADGAKRSVLISQTGAVRSVETETPVADLPQNVRDAVARDYAAYTVTAAARIEERSPAWTRYEAQVERGTEKIDLIYAADATLVERIDLTVADGCD